MLIRNAVVTDLPCIVDIYNQSVQSSAATLDLEETTVESRQEWFSHYGGRYPLIVAEEDGIVIGYCSLSKFRDKEGYHRTVESSVYLHEAHMGKGLGRALMTEMLNRAKDLHHHVVVAGITGGNEVSVRLHTALGFTFVGCFREVGDKFNQWQDVHFYQRIIDE